MSDVKARLPKAVPVLGVLTLAGLVAAGWLPRARRAEAVERQRAFSAAPRRVVTGVVQRAPAKATFSLSGTAAPMRAAVVTARGTGFVQSTLVDLGDPVKAGQVLAVLESPEVDEDVNRAKARLTEAEANVMLARSAAERSGRLSEQGVASKQQAEEAQSRLTTAIAAVETTRADTLRLSALKGFTRVVAPFAGVVTRRFIEQGALVSSDRAPLFEVAQTDTLKVTVDVPQWLAADVRPGLAVSIAAAQRPGLAVDARVTRSAFALDPVTRTLRVEALVEKPGALLANAFVQVTFTVERADPPLLVPASAVVPRADGVRVHVVNDGVIATTLVTIARDQGRTVEVLTGVAAGAKVVLNPPDDLENGERVEVIPPVQPDAGVAR
jgi:membrane fusion protein, multidrug efflux system